MLRLKKEFEALQKSPFHKTAIKRSEDRSDVWEVAMYGLFEEDPSIPFSFLIHFGKEYPIKPPSVGFNCPFPFSEGASYTIRDQTNILNDKFIICLNILGNFASVHGEWSTAKGEGWSSTCDVSYLLCQLFVVIGDNLKFRDISPSWGTERSLHERQETHAREVSQAAQAFKTYAERNSVPHLPLFQYPSSISLELRERIDSFYQGLVPSKQKEEFQSIISSFLLIAERREDVVEADEKGEADAKEGMTSFIAPSCCITLTTSDETLLFYGVAKEMMGMGKGDKYNLTTDCVPFSAEARLTNLPTAKIPFQLMIPCWINEKHGTSPDWLNKTMDGVCQFVRKELCQSSASNVDCVVKIYPDLINTLIVSMMKESDVTVCSRLFEGIINLWRSFHQLIRLNEKLQDRVIDILHRFTVDKQSRLKTVTPDVGHILVMFFAFTREGTEFEDPSSFMTAFEHESSLRRPLWWQKDRIMITPYATYQKSLVSVQNIVFQILFQKRVISATTLEEIDRTNCSLPTLLDCFLGEWKEVAKQLENDTKPWKTYYEILEQSGLPSSRVHEIQHADYLKNLVAEASTLKGYYFEDKGSRGGGGRRHW